ncbi:IS110 family transposase [Paenibacillus oryzisoli]|uniref:Transposase n=1 Tax=Paenibacillus oryzisoli TaxID=1850517 RepID=A0A198AX87_9BACL|nr:IS110 family transposase [Paenibacillus oryzisoli]OAS25448.1 transposase [Paenibacillus oryzisoli]
MDAVRGCCAGLDVHQKTVVACVLKGSLEHKPKRYIEMFGTTTKELLKLQDWLGQHECKEVVMESTGVLWKPVWNILESTCELVLANAKNVKNMPGRKTDIKDAQWLAQLHRSGLVQASMVPDQEIRDLRDLTRYRRKMIQALASEKNRIHKVLQDANIKLTTYVSDIFGVSGRALLQSLINGEVLDAEEIRSLVHSKLKRKVPELLEALNGQLRKHHRQMICEHWDHIAYLEQKIERLGTQIEQLLGSYKEEIEIIDSIPGIEAKAAADIFAEIGPQVAELFPSDAQFASWVGLCPGNNESAGKKKRSKTVQGNKHTKSTLCQVVWANSKSNNRIGRFFRQVRKRRGDKKASVATAHLLSRIIYALMRDKTVYKEEDAPIGGGAPKEKPLEYYLKHIQQMGYQIQLNKQDMS